ncbi:MAG: hypothetical protein IPL40_02315 [Proteobacteria bacterium]|nr:hypothetical protein [Pseudomonadota bacterium]
MPRRLLDRSSRRLLLRCCLIGLLSAPTSTAAQPEPTRATRPSAPRPAPAAAPAPEIPHWQQRGIALGLFAEEPDYDYGPLLAEIAATGATHVAIVLPYYQHDWHSVTIAPHPRFTPSDAAILRSIAQAHRHGLAVLLFPILRLSYQATIDEWRGTLAPRDPRRWWQSYTRLLLRLARVAARQRVAGLAIGSELHSLDQDARPWIPLVAALRRAYRGQLVYSANWLGYDRVALWPLVDVMGISAYFPLVGESEPPPNHERLVHAWREERVRLERWWTRMRKPLIFTELGYHSSTACAARPWEEAVQGQADLGAQAAAFAAFGQVWRDATFLRGLYVWNWFGWGGPRSREYTPRGKPAVDLICRWFGATKGRCPHRYGLPRVEAARPEAPAP